MLKQNCKDLTMFWSSKKKKKKSKLFKLVLSESCLQFFQNIDYEKTKVDTIDKKDISG